MKIGRIHTQEFCIKPDYWGEGGAGPSFWNIGGASGPPGPLVPTPLGLHGRLLGIKMPYVWLYYRSCYVDPLKCGTWVLTQEWVHACPGHYGIRVYEKTTLTAYTANCIPIIKSSITKSMSSLLDEGLRMWIFPAGSHTSKTKSAIVAFIPISNSYCILVFLPTRYYIIFTPSVNGLNSHAWIMYTTYRNNAKMISTCSNYNFHSPLCS